MKSRITRAQTQTKSQCTVRGAHTQIQQLRARKRRLEARATREAAFKDGTLLGMNLVQCMSARQRRQWQFGVAGGSLSQAHVVFPKEDLPGVLKRAASMHLAH